MEILTIAGAIERRFNAQVSVVLVSCAALTLTDLRRSRVVHASHETWRTQ